jgi:hypothetical protein
MALRDTIRRHAVGGLAIAVIAVLAVAAPGSPALADQPSAADDTRDPTGADGHQQPLVDLEVVEFRGVPDPTSFLARYPVITGEGGDLSGDALLRRSNQADLVAVVSDAPEDLRAKRRDLDAHDRAIALASGLPHVDSGWDAHVDVVEL